MLPGKAIVQALELEYRMIQNDFERNRYPLTEECHSILYFREFVQVVRVGGEVFFTRPFPPEHCEFYRQIVVRLIDANELPREALEKFDKLFAPIRFPLAA
ncbi:MAG TPA: hypothetical protein VME24_08230 [Alphaproteobacteria bacterium]|nr:hypothetical protein [Alphaproteobacteria bacterium]